MFASLLKKLTRADSPAPAAGASASPAPAAVVPAAAASSNDGGGLFTFGAKAAYKKQSEKTEATREYDLLFKLLVVGDSKVGKSCFILRFADDTFFAESFISTIGVDFKIRTLDIGGRVVKLQIWDTAGQERFRTITSSYYRGAHGIFLCYDITDRQSFSNAQGQWLQETDRYACENVSRILVGLQADRVDRRCVSTAEGRAAAEERGVGFAEASAKTGEGVEAAFLQMVQLIATRLGNNDVASNAARARPALAAPPAGDAPLNDDDAESFSDDELEADMAALAKKKKEKAPRDAKKAGGPKHRVAKADVNVFRLALSSLGRAADLVTGDPVLCRRCGVMFSAASSIQRITRTAAAAAEARCPLGASFVPAPPICSRLEQQSALANRVPLRPETDATEETRRFWCCEFCGAANDVELLDEGEIPKAPAVDYLIKPAPSAKSGAGAAGPIVFVIDTSGSMCVTTEVQGQHQIKGAARRDEKNRELARAHGDHSQQYLPRERRGVTHVSRLQCVQAALDAQIRRLARENPERRVGLVTFSNEVTLLGDGTQSPVHVAGDKLKDWQELLRTGAVFPLNTPVAQAQETLLSRVWELEESGATALGPALLLGVALAGSAPGSQVILCTDGLANQGLGSLEQQVEKADSNKLREQTAFYLEVAEQAVLKGVSVSVLSLLGTEASLENLSVVAEKTGGAVDRVDPRALTGQLDALVGAPPTLAYSTMAMVLLHRGLRFRGEMDDERDQRFWVVKDLGNVNANSECSFSYGFRAKDEVDLSGLTHLPFQVQLLYTRPDGSVYLRVATATVPLTEDRAVAEKDANVQVIGAHAAAHAARMAKEGNYEQAQLEARAAQRFLQRNGLEEEKLETFSAQMDGMDQVLRAERKKEKGHKKGGDETDVRERRELRSDEAAAAISKGTKLNSKSLF